VLLQAWGLSPLPRQRHGRQDLEHNDKEMIMSTTFGTAAIAQGGAPSARSHSLLGAAKRAWVAYMAWRIDRVAIDQLCAMSDRQLKDIGLTRSEIAAAARGTLRARR
jgi:uncharacterized protein YjiS (DUF1127 family)